MIKIVKNNTANPLRIKDTGVDIVASGQYLIPPDDYNLWAASNDIITEISNSNTTINDGSKDLTIAEGIRLIQIPGDISIQEDDVDIVNVVKILNFEGDVSVVDNTNGKSTVTIGEQGTAKGKLFDFSFVNTGSTYNKWLEFDSSSAPSNEAPLIVPWDCNLIGLGYTNVNNDTEINAEIYKNGVLVFTWEIRNKWTAINTNITAMGFLAGDRISVFFRQEPGGTPASKRPNKTALDVYLISTSDVEQEIGQQNNND